MHCLVSHGSFGVRNPPPVDFQQLRLWFQDSPEGRVEGIVWHCNDGTLIKVRSSTIPHYLLMLTWCSSSGASTSPGPEVAGWGHTSR